MVLADEAATLGRFPFHDSYRFQDKVFARIVVGPADVQADTPGIYNIFFLVDGDRDLPALRPEGERRQRPVRPREDLDGRRFWQLGYMTEQNSSAGLALRFTLLDRRVDLPEGRFRRRLSVASLVRDGEVMPTASAPRPHPVRPLHPHRPSSSSTRA
ncbi:MAG: hypothetical protein R3D28_20190 [Geminicoccaceae bacterium]